MKAGLDSLGTRHRIVLGIALGVSLIWGFEFAASVALGGGMQAINLAWLERTVRSWAARAQHEEFGGVSKSAGLRLVLLLSTVGAVFLLMPVDPIGLTVGLSTAVPAVLWHGLTSVEHEA